MKAWLFLALCLGGTPAGSETLVAAHTLRAQTILSAGDLAPGSFDTPGAIRDPDVAIGLQTRVAIYQGKPIFLADLGQPSIISRNQLVTLSFRQRGLTILAEGRALERGGAGDRIRAMNLASHAAITGIIEPDGTLRVEPSN